MCYKREGYVFKQLKHGKNFFKNADKDFDELT